MEFEFFIGIDVSKNELDFAVRQGKQLLFHQETINGPEAVNAFLNGLGKLAGFDLGKAVFCMEHTGIYGNHLLACLHKKKAHLCLEAATQIKNSLGNIRGKNDKIDAIRIAEYAYFNREKLRLWEPKREVVQRLSHFAAVRSRLIKVKKLLKTPLKEQGGFVGKSIAKENNMLCKATLNAIEKDLEKVEKAIMAIIAADDELKRLFGLIVSVTGIGKATAVQMLVTTNEFLVTTNEFKDINDPKQYACYAGVAPFTKESGMFKGKAQVSHMANKKVKVLLHLSAMVAIRYNPDLKLYYQRKVNEDKKNKMSAINAVRNKLISRIFACVNQNRNYEKNYSRLVA